MNDPANSAAVPMYPVTNFATALETAAAVSEAGGVNNDVPKSVIASLLKVSGSSGAFIQRLAVAP